MARPMSKRSPENKEGLPQTVGLTGGIGAGKSVVAKLFAVLGVPVFNSDDVSKSLLSSDEAVIDKVKAAFGSESYHDGKPDRAFLASKVFTSDEERKKLNAIMHPAVARAFEHWLGQKRTAPYVLKEAAILFETGIAKELDAIILVIAPAAIRIARVMERDGTTTAQVEDRMKAQWSDEKKIALSDYIIKNDGVEALIPQILHFHNTILGKA